MWMGGKMGSGARRESMKKAAPTVSLEVGVRTMMPSVAAIFRGPRLLLLRRWVSPLLIVQEPLNLRSCSLRRLALAIYFSSLDFCSLLDFNRYELWFRNLMFSTMSLYSVDQYFAWFDPELASLGSLSITCYWSSVWCCTLEVGISRICLEEFNDQKRREKSL